MVPEEFSQRMQRMLGGEYPAFEQAYTRPRAVGLRFNPLKTADLPELPFDLSPVPWAEHGYFYNPDTRPGLHPYHEAGVYYLQEPSAMAPAQLLQPQPGEWILDLCAAPGGKSTQIAAAMQGQGLLVCNEIHPGRAKILARNIERMGISNAVVLNETPQRLAQRFAGCFDRILVDAPCSGEGMFRKEAAAVSDWSQQAVQHCADRQLEILTQAAKMLRPGGRLVYSTCTFSPEENEGVISAFVSQQPEFTIIPPPHTLFAPGRPDWVAQPVSGLANTCRLWPHLLRGEGHFAAILQHTGDGSRTILPPVLGQKPPALWQDFAAEYLTVTPTGKLLQFGQTLWAAPEELPSLDGMRVLRTGLELGQLCKNRLEPAHALALWLPQAGQMLQLEPAQTEIALYLQGQTLPCSSRGWTLVCAGPYSIGWGKTSGGTLKNHYPKGLRRAPGTISPDQEG